MKKTLPLFSFVVGVIIIQIAKSSCGNEIVGGGRELVPLRGHENLDSGVETPVPALFLGRGCSSTPSSRVGPDASAHGISAISLGNQYIPNAHAPDIPANHTFSSGEKGTHPDGSRFLVCCAEIHMAITL